MAIQAGIDESSRKTEEAKHLVGECRTHVENRCTVIGNQHAHIQNQNKTLYDLVKKSQEELKDVKETIKKLSARPPNPVKLPKFAPLIRAQPTQQSAPSEAAKSSSISPPVSLLQKVDELSRNSDKFKEDIGVRVKQVSNLQTYVLPGSI